jgi:hypothetical protein
LERFEWPENAFDKVALARRLLDEVTSDDLFIELDESDPVGPSTRSLYSPTLGLLRSDLIRLKRKSRELAATFRVRKRGEWLASAYPGPEEELDFDFVPAPPPDNSLDALLDLHPEDEPWIIGLGDGDERDRDDREQ